MGKKKTVSNKVVQLDNLNVINDLTNPAVKESYISTRTNLIFSLMNSSNKIVTFMSQNFSDGATATSVNIAISLAETGAKVLIIDADLRKPSVHKMLKVKNDYGLSSILSGKCTVSDAISKNVRENLDCITAGTIPSNPAELVVSPNTKGLLDVLSKHYDYICIDTSPIKNVSDALLFNPHIAGIIFVVKENSTRHGDIKSALDKIKFANGNVLGIVKTSCRTSLMSRLSGNRDDLK